MKTANFKKFATLSFQYKKWANDVPTKHEIETGHLFSNQFNTVDGLRIFLWSEAIFPNKNIKEGYYLTGTSDLMDLVNARLSCGYTGQQFTDSELLGTFNLDALSSQHLTEDCIHLLRIAPITQSNRKELTVEEMEYILPLYTDAQIHGTNARSVARKSKHRTDLLAKRDKDIQDANEEYDGFIWLLDRGINTNNCIFYSHTGMFGFGWREAMSEQLEEKLREKLADFPFQYKIETK